MEINLLNQDQTMSSREIAQLTGKRHDHVLRDIDVLNETYDKIGLPKTGEGYYTHPNTGNQQHREMLLTRMQTMDLVTGYNVELRIAVNRRWEQLESEKKQLGVPHSFSEALKLAYEQSLVIEKQQNLLEEQKPKVVFADAFQISEDTVLVGELAKILKQNNINIGQNRLFETLRSEGYLIKGGEQRNLPTQKAMELKIFEIKTTTIHALDGGVKVKKTPKVTAKGVSYFVNKFLSNQITG